jgi:hypothetical protein
MILSHTETFIEMWNADAPFEDIARKVWITPRSVPQKARKLRLRGFNCKPRNTKRTMVRYEDVKDRIDWTHYNKDIESTTGLTVAQVAYYRTKQPPPHNRSPRMTPELLAKKYPLATNPRNTFRVLCDAYRLSEAQAKYVLARIGIPRSLKNYRKGRGK